jgi:hypothetical protein
LGIIPGLTPGQMLKVGKKEVHLVSEFKEVLTGGNQSQYSDWQDAMKNTDVMFNYMAAGLKEGDVFTRDGGDYLWIVDKVLKDGRIKAKRDRQTPNMAKKGSVKHEVASTHLMEDDKVHVITGPGKWTMMAYNAIMQRKKMFGK